MAGAILTFVFLASAAICGLLFLVNLRQTGKAEWFVGSTSVVCTALGILATKLS